MVVADEDRIRCRSSPSIRFGSGWERYPWCFRQNRYLRRHHRDRHPRIRHGDLSHIKPIIRIDHGDVVYGYLMIFLAAMERAMTVIAEYHRSIAGCGMYLPMTDGAPVGE